MPRPHPPEFRRRAVELANQRGADGNRLQPVAKTATDLGISDSCLRNWIAKAAVDAGERPGLSTDEAKSWSSCVGATGCWRPRTKSSSGRRPTSPGRTSSQNDLRLHLPTLRRPARRNVLPGDGGVDVWVLRVAGEPGQRAGLGRRGADRHHRGHPPGQPPPAGKAHRRRSCSAWCDGHPIRSGTSRCHSEAEELTITPANLATPGSRAHVLPCRRNISGRRLRTAGKRADTS